MELRPMTPGDYPAVVALWNGSAGVRLRGTDDSQEIIDRFLLRNPGLSLVAEENGAIIGAVLCGHDGRRGHLYHMAVREDFRGRGVGRALTRAALAGLSREGITRVALTVIEGNESGNAFWQSLGFEARGDLVYRNICLTDENTAKSGDET